MEQIKQYFGQQQDINYDDIIRFYQEYTKNYYLREITSNTFWKVEAVITYFINNKLFKVIFDDDVLSPYRKYNQNDIELILKKLDEKYQEVSAIIDRKLNKKV
jgi:hypothetical protein